jgi:hypothetical protein
MFAFCAFVGDLVLAGTAFHMALTLNLLPYHRVMLTLLAVFPLGAAGLLLK